MIQPDPNPQEERAGPMRYAMLGPDASTTEEKLEKFTGEVTWDYLRPHFESGALLFVDASLDLMVVGRALADDDVEAVKAWRGSGDLVSPSEPHSAYWEANDFTFRALVVSPFVLVQQVGD